MTSGLQHDLQQRARRALAGGVSSNTRLLNPHLIVQRAAGCRIWDADGTEYLDYLLGQGPNILGYAPPRVVEKVLAAQRHGVIYAATHQREIEAAERVLAVLGWAETMRFGSSSTEMVQAALRMARAATGRTRVVRFHGHYHGWLDNIYTRNEGAAAVPASLGQPADALRDVSVLEWNDVQAVEQIMTAQGSEIAAVIMEPLMLNAGVIVPEPGYLEAVRAALHPARRRAHLRRDDQRLPGRARRGRGTLRRASGPGRVRQGDGGRLAVRRDRRAA